MDMKRIGLFILCLVLFPVMVIQVSGGRPLGKCTLLDRSDSKPACPSQLHQLMKMVYGSEFMASLCPERKDEFPRCLITKGFQVALSTHVMRRHLADQSQSPSPAFAPAPVPSRASTLSPNARLKQHTDTTESDGLPPKPNKKIPPRKVQEDATKTIVIAVVLSSVGTFLLFLCAFCCYKKCQIRNWFSVHGRDESPLLSINLGSSDKSQNSHAFSTDDNFNGTSASDRLSESYASSDPSCELKHGNGPKVLLPPPPGRLSVSTVSLPTAPSASPPATTVMLPGTSAVPPATTAATTLATTIVLHTTPAVLPTATPPRASPSQPSALLPSPLPPSAAAAPPPPPPPPLPPPSHKPSPFSNVAPPPPLQPPIHNSKHGAQSPPPPSKGGLPRHSEGTSKTLQPPNLNANGDANAPKAKLKPFFWDKVTANPNQSNVWSQIRSGSFHVDEEMIESVFGFNAAAKRRNEGKKESSTSEPSIQYIQLLDSKKSQNLAISLKALNVKKQEVFDALTEGNELPTALLQTLLKMQPTSEEELKIRLYTGDASLLRPAEEFLKHLIDIPFLYKRMDALLFMSSLHEDVSSIKDSFATLQAACTELRSHRLFLKLLEAVLKTGNRMNDGTYRGGAQAFKLDTLLKLSDVKGTDGKTTLLIFVVQEIIRSEGMRASRLAREGKSLSNTSNSSFSSIDLFDYSSSETGDRNLDLGLKLVSSLSSELVNVKKAAVLDSDAIASTVANLGRKLMDIKQFLNADMANLEEDSGFHHSLKCFVEHAEAAITFLWEEEQRIRTLVRSTIDYFQGSAGKDEGLRLFVIVRDFLGMLDRACREVRQQMKVQKAPKIRSSPPTPTTPDPRRLLFPAITDRRTECPSSSSDEDDP